MNVGFIDPEKTRGNSPTLFSRINLSGILIENYFCPEDECEDRVLELLQEADEEIRKQLAGLGYL